MKKWVMFILLLCLGLISCSKEADPKKLITVHFVLGKASINDKQVQRGDILPQVFRVETGFGSVLDLTIGEKNIYRIQENSILEIDLQAETPVFFLQKGALAGLSRKKFTQASYQIRTPAVSAGVRGTSFFVKNEDSLTSYFCVCNGSIDLKGVSSVSEPEKVTAAHHSARRFQLAGEKIRMDQNPGMLYHSDSEMESLAAQIGESINWNLPDLH